MKIKDIFLKREIFGREEAETKDNKDEMISSKCIWSDFITCKDEDHKKRA